jgi:hypothetical protein
MRRQLILSAAICVGLLTGLFPAAVLAQDFNAPPGNSGVDQYLETVPKAGGNSPGSDRKSSGLPARTLKSLRSAGSDGQAVANLVASSGTTRAKQPSTKRSNGEKQQSNKRRSEATTGSSKIPGTIAAPTLGGSGSGGMGLLLPVLLGLSTVGALLFALRRRRSQ